MTTPTRIYLVTNGDDEHLIDASNKVVAINHVARKGIKAHVATQTELVAKIQAGVEIEKAGNDG